MKLEENFAHWIKTAAAIGNISADKYENRIAAVGDLTDDIGKKEALDLLRIYCGLTPNHENASSSFAAFFKERDPSFDTRDAAFVFQVLSAISLIQVLNKTSSDVADAVGLAHLTYTFGGKKKVLPDESVSADLDTAARNYLHEESSRMRGIGVFNEIKVTDNSDGETNKLNLKDLKTAADQNTTLTATLGHTLFTSVDKAVTSIAKEQAALINSVNEELKDLRRALRVNAEETNIFWWLNSEWSRDMEKPYSEFNSSEACLLAGKELADITVFIPGHNSTLGFLSRILKLTRSQASGDGQRKTQQTLSSITIKEAVNNAPEEWNKDWLATGEVKSVLDFCPLHFALLKRIELGKDEWNKLFDRQVGIKTSTAFRPYELSYQFFQERMVVQATA